MEKKSKLQELYDLARVNNLASSKREFAEFIGIDVSSLSHALKDDGRVSLSNTIQKAEHALMKSGVVINGMGDGSIQNVSGSNNSIGVPSKNFAHESDWFALIAEKDKQIDRLLTIIENMQK